MTDIWIVLIEDRHAGVEALPFSSEEQAVAEALLANGAEGNRVRVVKRTLDG